MRTVTTILLLCLPMAAMGETYVCTSTVGKVIDEEIGFVSPSGKTWVADIERGLRVTSGEGVDEDYIGGCESTFSSLGLFILCKADKGSNTHVIKIRETVSEITFMASLFTAYLASYVGKCTRV